MVCKYSEHERMKLLKSNKNIDAISRYLETTNRLTMTYDQQCREEAWVELGSCDEIESFRMFFEWIEENIKTVSGVGDSGTLTIFRNKHFNRSESSIYPSNELFADYCKIDMRKIDQEKDQMLNELRDNIEPNP